MQVIFNLSEMSKNFEVVFYTNLTLILLTQGMTYMNSTSMILNLFVSNIIMLSRLVL